MAGSNPYAHGRTEQEFASPDYPQTETGRYAAPGYDEDAPWNDEQGWSPSLRVSPTSEPDSARLGTTPLRQYRPDGSRAPEEFWDPIDKDDRQRHSVEDVDANGWSESKGISGGDKRWEYNPRLHPPPEPRLTNLLSPRTYSFTRPFLTNTPKISARLFTGEHFSMADHRRTYDIGGMAPAKHRRNTWRIDPTPWDVDYVDVPPDTTPDVPQARLQSVEVAYGNGNRNWRL